MEECGGNSIVLVIYVIKWSLKTDTPDSATRAGVRSWSTESGDYDEYWTDCLNIYM